MRITPFILSLLLSFSSSILLGQSSQVESYVEDYYQMAVEEMKNFGIPASITLAQGILESGSGNSRLAVKANNHFGIKCHTSWTGDKIFHDDDKRGECFRVYTNAAESFRDHSLFLFHRSRYSSLFDLKIDDYAAWAKGLKKAGYATNPKYAHLLIDLIEKYNLAKYDAVGQRLIAMSNNVDQDEKVNTSTTIANRDVPVSDNVETEGPKIANKSYSVPEIYKGEIFIFNRIKTIIAQKDDNLQSIADKYDIKPQRLRKYNELELSDLIVEGMYVYLQPKRKKGNQRYHVVKPGESMYDIAQAHGMKVESLYERNLMVPNEQPVASEILHLRKHRESNPETQSYQSFLDNAKEYQRQMDIFDDRMSENIDEPSILEASNDRGISAPTVETVYKVETGDTLYSISRWFKVSVSDLKEWNALSSDEISIGQTLIVGK